MQHQTTKADRAIARIAGAAKGVVTHAELRSAGITPEAIRQRRLRGSLFSVFRGVYRVGHAAPSTEATYMAAVKAGGKGAVLSGRAAAHHLRLIHGPPPRPEITAPGKRLIEGVATRRATLHPSERMVHDGIPATSPARTLVDLAGILRDDEDALGRAVHEAQIRFRTTPARVEAVLRLRPNAKGGSALRRILSGGAPTILSKLEATFIRVLRRNGLPLPETNRPAGGRYVDCRWADKQVTVELDSYRYHNSRHSWERDRLREREAYERGDQFRRYTWHDVCEHPRQMLRELSELLA